MSDRVGGFTAIAAGSFTRPADTTAYASGDLVANSTTAGSVVPVPLTVSRHGGNFGGMVRRARLRKSSTSLTNAAFRLHFYRGTAPVPSNGDNGVWLTDQCINYVGAIDVTCDKAFTDGASGNGVPNTGAELNYASPTLYCLIEARAAYTPAIGETFNIELETIQN